MNNKIIALVVCLGILATGGLFARDALLFVGNEYQKLSENARLDIVSDIADTVVVVDSSSGIIIYSNNEYSLVLTANHVIMEDIKNNDPIEVASMLILLGEDGTPKGLIDKVEAKIVGVDEKKDLALLRVPFKNKPYSKVGRLPLRLGQRIYSAGNPNFNYETIASGVVSNVRRVVIKEDGTAFEAIQVDAGTIFGQSGGGLFNESGELVGVASGVDLYEGDPVTYCGYYVRGSDVRNFLLRTEYKHNFDYLR